MVTVKYVSLGALGRNPSSFQFFSRESAGQCQQNAIWWFLAFLYDFLGLILGLFGVRRELGFVWLYLCATDISYKIGSLPQYH